jgi:hypothetical protein
MLLVELFYPCFEIGCCGGPHCSCCGICLVSLPCLWVTCGLCLWSLMIVLTLVAFVPRPYVLWLLCCLSRICLSWGSQLIKLCVLYFRGSWHVWLSLMLGLISLALRGSLFSCYGFRGSMVFCHSQTSCFGCRPLEFRAWYLPSLWLGLRGVDALSCILYIFLFSCIFFILK